MELRWRALAWLSLLLATTAAAVPSSTVAQEPQSLPPDVTDEPQSRPPDKPPARWSLPEPEPAAAKVREVEHWYGWQTLTIDGVSAALALGAYLGNSEAPLELAIIGYVFGPPVVHLVHRNYGSAATSLALRVAIPLVVGISTLWGSAGCDDEETCGLDTVLIALPIAMIGVMIFDAALLARETITEPATVQPVAAVDRDQAFLGLRGAL